MTYPAKELSQLTNASELSNLLESDKFSIFNVMSYANGTTINDGVTDATSAIQAAIDAVEDNDGGIIQFPVGIFLITSTIIIPVGPYLLIGSGNYETSKGTRLVWGGSGTDSMFQVSEYNVFEKMFIYATVSTRTGATCIDAEGDYVGSRGSPNHLTFYDVHIKNFETGISLVYSYFNLFTQVSVTYCDTGIKFGTETNNIGFYECHIQENQNGVYVEAGTRQVLFSSCDFERNDLCAIDMTDDGISNYCYNWSIRDCYFESNRQSIRACGRNSVIDNLHINHDWINYVGNSTTACIEFFGADSFECKNIWFSSDIATVNGIAFSGTLTSADYYTPSSVVVNGISQHYLAKAIETYPNIFFYGHLNTNLSNVEVLTTELLDASAAQNVQIIPKGILSKYHAKKLILAYLVIDTQIVVPISITVNFGTNSATYDNISSTAFNTNVAVGYQALPLDVATPTISSATEYRFKTDAQTSGKFRLMFVFVG